MIILKKVRILLLVISLAWYVDLNPLEMKESELRSNPDIETII